MKRTVLLISLTFLLNACGNPSVVAYARGVALQAEADAMLHSAGKIDNKIEAKYFQAIEQFNSALHFDPNLADAYYRRGVCRESIQQCDAAVIDYSEAARLRPNEGKIWMRRGGCEMEMQNFQDAIKDFNAGDALSPGSEWLYLKRGYCKLYVGDKKGALADAQDAVALDESSANLSLLAAAQRAAGNYAEMDAAYQRAIKADPHDFSTYRSRAYSELMIGRYKDALRDFKAFLNGKDWKGEGTPIPYAVLLGTLSAKLDKNEAEAKSLLEEGMKRLNIPREVDKNAHNAPVSNDWPEPCLQYLHKDITRDKIIRAGQGDVGKETEVNCYLGIEAFCKGDKKAAQQYFDTVLKTGRRDYVEWDIAQRLRGS